MEEYLPAVMQKLTTVASPELHQAQVLLPRLMFNGPQRCVDDKASSISLTVCM